MSVKALTPISLPADPVQPLEAATKQYVDTQDATRLTQTAADARYVMLIGGSMTGPLSATRMMVTEAAPTAANHLTRKDYVDAQVAAAGGLYVDVAGDTMTGRLNTTSALRLNGDNAHLQWFDAAGTTERAHMSAMADRLVLNSQQPVLFEVGPAERMRITPDGKITVKGLFTVDLPADYWTGATTIFFGSIGHVGSDGSNRVGIYSNTYRNGSSTSTNGGGFAGASAVEVDPAGIILFRADATIPTANASTIRMTLDSASVDIKPTVVLNFGAGTRQMVNLYSSTYGIGVQSSTLYMRNGGNFAIYVGGVHSNVLLDPGAGGTEVFSLRTDDTARLSRQLRVAYGGTQPLLLLANGNANAPIIGFYPGDTETPGTRKGYIGYPSTIHMYVNNETPSGYLYLDSGSSAGIILRINGVEYSRQATTAFLIGKAAYNTYGTSSGVEIWNADGQVMITQTTATFNSVNHIGAADVNGCSFWRFYRTGTAQLGNIAQLNTTGVTYGATSDKRLKTFLRDVDDDEALDALRHMTPVHFTWDHAPEVGEQIGFFAQDLYETAPEAVAVGVGEPGDEDFVPWMTDLGKMVPRLVAAIQALDRRVTKLAA